MAQAYEITVILRPEGTDEQIKQHVTRVEEQVRKEGGALTATESWGRRRLAFPLKKQREGVYILLRAELDGPTVQRVQRALRLDDQVLRAMIIAADEASTGQAVPARGVTPIPAAREEWTR